MRNYKKRTYTMERWQLGKHGQQGRSDVEGRVEVQGCSSSFDEARLCCYFVLDEVGVINGEVATVHNKGQTQLTASHVPVALLKRGTSAFEDQMEQNVVTCFVPAGANVTDPDTAEKISSCVHDELFGRV